MGSDCRRSLLNFRLVAPAACIRERIRILGCQPLDRSLVDCTNRQCRDQLANPKRSRCVMFRGLFTDVLFRSANTGSRDASAEAEAARLLNAALTSNQIAPADQAYLSRLVASRTGLSQVEADKRVSDTLLRAREFLDTMRKSTAYLLLRVFLGFVMGAFNASFAATIGGRQRDHVRTV